MALKSLIGLLVVVFFISFVSAWSSEAICGNNKCEAGYRLGADNYLEDISTCFKDCESADWVKCDVDSLVGGECNFNGKVFKFSNLKRTGCGGTSEIDLSFDLEYQGHKQNFPGAEPYYYIPAFDNIAVSYAVWPCSVATTQQTFYLKGVMGANKFSNFMTIQTNNLNLKKMADSSFDLIFAFDYQGLSGPRLKLDIKNSETGESLGSSTGFGSLEQRMTIYPDSTKPGKYLLTAILLDSTDTNIISQQDSNLIINQCSVNEECKDEKFWTKDICSGSEYKVCSNPPSYLLIGAIALVSLLVLILVVFIVKKASPQKTY